MAAALPAIHSAVAGGKSPTVTQHRIISPRSKTGGGGTILIGHPQKCSQGKKDREVDQRRIDLRAQQPSLNKLQASQYRNTYKHNLSLDMLQEGFHRSFTELFILIRQQNDERDRAGPESSIWNETLLENEPEKLEMLKAYLTKAEDAQRKDIFSEVYACQYKLARYFQTTGDKWLSDHFFNLCLTTSTGVKTDGGKLAAVAHCNVGLALEESGDNFEAAGNFEMFYELTRGRAEWELEEGQSMDTEACKHLCRIYTSIAEEFESSGDLKQYLSYLQKAYDMAKEGAERRLLGLASFRLGIAFEKNRDSEYALLYLNGYLDICQGLDDLSGVGKACEAIAKSYESQDQVEESIKYLEMFVEVAERSKDDIAISRACSDLGAMFNSLGRYEQAVEYFNKSYNIARSMNDTETISSSRVLFGVAAAHKMLEAVTQHIDYSSRVCVERLIEWKDNRGDEFDRPIPKPEKKPTPATQQQEEKETDEKKEES